MKQLQETTPVLFDLIFVLGHYPSIITPILKEMIIKSQVPFSVVPSTDDDINLSESGVLYDDEITNLCYFPTLPLIRRRRNYEADSSKRTIVCTKQNAGHPSLLPGVFTLFCHHGKLLALIITNLTFLCTIL